MADAPCDQAVLVAAGELRPVGRRLGMWCAVGVALHRDRGYADRRRRGELPLERIVARLPLRDPKPPAVVVDHDRDVIRVVERLGRAFIGRIIEAPLWRRGLPDQLVEIVAVLLVAGAAALGREIELVPPGEFSLRWQWRRVCLLAAD